MGRSSLFLVVMGCGFHSAASPPDAARAADAAAPGLDGSVADTRSFGPDELAAGRLVGMTFDRVRGSLTPNAYTYGGLAVHGVPNVNLWSTGDTSWSRIATVVPAGAGLWRGEGVAATDPLDNVGIPAAAQKLTMWLDGEVWLVQGSNEQFSVTAGGFAFFQIAPPGASEYGAAIEIRATPIAIAVATPVTGWYPIRIGLAYASNTNHGFAFQHSAAGGSPVAWTRDRLRARASELTGPLRTVFFRQILGGGPGSQLPTSHVDDSAPAMTTRFPDVPPGAPSSNVRWSARYAAQVYVAQPGTYTLGVASDDGNHIALGGVSATKSWAFGAGLLNDPSTVTATLPAGWADLIVDYNQVDGDRNLQVTLAGPGVSGGIPPGRLRPVEPADDRLAYGSEETPRTIPDNRGPPAVDPAMLNVLAYGDGARELVTAIDMTYEIDSQRWDQLRFDLETPGGTRVNVPTPRNPTGPGKLIGQASIDASTTGTSALLGVPASGSWKLHVYDVGTGGGASSLNSAKLTLHTRGGPDKVARAAAWFSAPIDTGSAVYEVDGVNARARLPDGATLQVHVASCQRADCSDAAWADADALVVSSAAPIAVAPARYLQLRVDLTSNGSVEPELQSLAVAFRRAP